MEDVNLDNILIDEKSHKNIFIYDISHKSLIGPKPLRIIFKKYTNLLEFMIELYIYHCLVLKIMKTKTNSKYWIGNSDKAIRPLILIMPKMSLMA